MVKLSELKSSQEIATAELQADSELAAEYERLAVARDVALQVIRYRMQKGLSQTALGRVLNMPQPAIARLETGEHEPTLATLRKLARALGLDFSVEIKPSKPVRLRNAAKLREWDRAHHVSPTGSGVKGPGSPRKSA